VKIYWYWPHRHAAASALCCATLRDIEIEQQSAPFLNMAAQRAVVATRQLPPLPAAFTGDHLTVHLVFQFKR